MNLIDAVKAGHEKQVERFLQEGADPDGVVFFTPLLVYALSTNRAAIARLLVRYGADVHVLDHQGWTPLHRAALIGDLTLVNLLLNAGARLGARDWRGKTPLDVAREYGNAEMIALLETWRNRRRKRERKNK